MKTISFIGGGNMATAIINGLLKAGISPDSIWVSDLHQEKLDLLRDKYKINTTIENQQACRVADILLLAVKPQIMSEVLSDIADTTKTKKPLVISIAAGVTINKIAEKLGEDIEIVRCMPNTPALIQQGITALYAGQSVSESNNSKAETIMNAVGDSIWVNEESDLDKVTAVSGSGPAYFFLILELIKNREEDVEVKNFIKKLLPLIRQMTIDKKVDTDEVPTQLFLACLLAIEQAANDIGLDATTSFNLVKQTSIGALELALTSQQDIILLRKNVTSEGGTTAAALAVLQESDLEQTLSNDVVVLDDITPKLNRIFHTAINAAYKRSLAL